MKESTFSETLKRLEKGNIYQRAVAVALRYGNIGGERHKMWVIDQMVRILSGGAYDYLVNAKRAADEEWDEGIAP